MFHTTVIFSSELLLAPHTKLGDHPLSDVHDSLFNIFTANFHSQRMLLHLQPEDAPFHDDKNPLITDHNKANENVFK
jgi:hypothetical protein